MNYEEFIESKVKRHISYGFEVLEKDLNKGLFPFQKFIIKKALEAGKYAIFADCGLGKTFMQLEWAKHVVSHTNKPVLILAPLAVVGQTIKEGIKFGIEISRYQNDADSSGIVITNYDQLKNIDVSVFSGVVLDESSILKNFTGKMRNLVIDNFINTPYKLACTATPSPNDPMELGNHSEFLDIMKRNEMLAMYFIHDGGNTSKWRLKGHAEINFYKWVSSWAVMIGKPSDIGFDDDGYCLPDLLINDHQIKTAKRDNGSLFNSVAVSATDFNKELRATMSERVNRAVELANDTDGQVIIWIKQNQEGVELRKLLPDAIEVKGGDKPEVKEKNLLGFANNEFRILITKAKIAQFGLNYQNCNTQIFAAIDFSFEGLYQAIRRSYRFGQDDNVNIHIITTDTMQNVTQSINRKQKQFTTMQQEMSLAVSEHHKNAEKMTNKPTGEIIETNDYKIQLCDCVQGIKSIESESVGMSIFSPPFSELYTYSDSVEDMGNSKDYTEFMAQFKYLVDELYRVLKSGRNVAVHCMDLPIQKGKEGFIGLRDFSGMLLKVFGDAGFIYHSRVTIWKNPVTEMQRTKALGLLHKQLKKDSTMSRVGIPDYLLIFRKDGERLDPVKTNIPVDLWQKWASPVWMDIDYSNTLNKMPARDDKDEKHICPLQLETIERSLGLYSNPGDIVLSPFAGIGSEGFQAIKMNRKFIGFELKASYFNIMKQNLKSAVLQKRQISLF